MSLPTSGKQATTHSLRIERGIFKRGPHSYQVKLRVGTCWITQTFDTLEDAKDNYELKRIARARDADFERITASRQTNAD